MEGVVRSDRGRADQSARVCRVVRFDVVAVAVAVAVNVVVVAVVLSVLFVQFSSFSGLSSGANIAVVASRPSTYASRSESRIRSKKNRFADTAETLRSTDGQRVIARYRSDDGIGKGNLRCIQFNRGRRGLAFDVEREFGFGRAVEREQFAQFVVSNAVGQPGRAEGENQTDASRSGNEERRVRQVTRGTRSSREEVENDGGRGTAVGERKRGRCHARMIPSLIGMKMIVELGPPIL